MLLAALQRIHQRRAEGESGGFPGARRGLPPDHGSPIILTSDREGSHHDAAQTAPHLPIGTHRTAVRLGRLARLTVTLGSVMILALGALTVSPTADAQPQRKNPRIGILAI